jgi:hypothetical protein
MEGSEVYLVRGDRAPWGEGKGGDGDDREGKTKQLAQSLLSRFREILMVVLPLTHGDTEKKGVE